MQKAASDAAIDSMRQSKGTIEGIADTQVMKAGEDADAKAATFFDKKETDRENAKAKEKKDLEDAAAKEKKDREDAEKKDQAGRDSEAKQEKKRQAVLKPYRKQTKMPELNKKRRHERPMQKHGNLLKNERPHLRPPQPKSRPMLKQLVLRSVPSLKRRPSRPPMQRKPFVQRHKRNAKSKRKRSG